MLEKLTVQLEKDIIDKFEIALNLSGEEKSVAVEKLINNYISAVFAKVSKEHKVTTTKGEKAMTSYQNDYGKAIRKIPKWANSPQQKNHKILRAFFQIEDDLGTVPYYVLEKRCNDKDGHPDIYVPTFKSNFDQMKIDNPKSHGKVFEVVSDKVVLWDYTKGTLLEYKDNFLR